MLDALMSQTRRIFVQRLAFVGGGTVLLGGCKDDKPIDAGPPAIAKKPHQALTSSHRTFTDGEWDIVSAACERVLPKDQDPGALDAHVPEYLDRILQSPQLQKMKADFIPGIAALDRRANRMFQKGFAACAPAQQDELLTIFKDSPEKSGEQRWYETLIVLSLEGFLGDPSYGGNKDRVGWALVGFSLVGTSIADPAAGYDGVRHLHTAMCGGGKGC
ncbi:MAG: hypothetical protein H6Q89_1620 [Myxococcaceae bacterium]|nr:hypothetical protein [Myxococcaceae bacterium]